MDSKENPLVHCDIVRNSLEQIKKIHSDLVNHEHTFPKCEICKLNHTEFYSMKSQLYLFLQDFATTGNYEEFPITSNALNLDIVKDEEFLETKEGIFCYDNADNEFHEDENDSQALTNALELLPAEAPKGKSKKREHSSCHICSRKFYKKERLTAHIATHAYEPKVIVGSCEICNINFHQEGRYQAHMARHTGDKPFECPECDGKFKSWDYFVRHRKKHTKPSVSENTHTIPKTENDEEDVKEMSNPKEIKKPRKGKTRKEKLYEKLISCSGEVQQGVKAYECEYCGCKFTKKDKLIFHIKHHIKLKVAAEEETNDLRCKICHLIFNTIRGLRKHLKFHERDPYFAFNRPANQIDIHTPYNCKICNRKFTNAIKLRRHVELRDSYKLHCKTCRVQVCSAAALYIHEKTIHKVRAAYQCTHCPEEFNNFKLIVKHHKAQHPDSLGPTKPFLCDVCGTSWADSRELRNHLMKHFGTRPYKCDVCNKTFHLEKYLEGHRRVHIPKSQLPTYDCDGCEKKGFRTKVALWKHKRIHTGAVTEIFCEVCGKRFINAHCLENHLLTHENEGARPYKCGICIKSFKILKECNKHRKKQHGILTDEMIKLREKKESLM